MDYEEVDARYLTFSESAASLRDEAIDGAIISVGFPAAAVLEATTTGGARLLSFEADRVAVLQERYPYYSPGGIPVGVYPGAQEEVATVAMMNWIVADETLDDDVVIRLLDILRDRKESLEQVHEMASQIQVSALEEAPIPLHPATERWMADRAGTEEPGG
jgi:TRAP transporter TAXI family solute receptor